jgi:hypothetical protein
VVERVYNAFAYAVVVVIFVVAAAIMYSVIGYLWVALFKCIILTLF